MLQVLVILGRKCGLLGVTSGAQLLIFGAAHHIPEVTRSDPALSVPPQVTLDERVTLPIDEAVAGLVQQGLPLS